MATRGYVPDASDVVWLEFDPQAGHEQAGHRPALVISPVSYNGKTGLMVCCPMTIQIKGLMELATLKDLRKGVNNAAAREHIANVSDAKAVWQTPTFPAAKE